MENSDPVDKKIIDLLKEGKEPKDIATILNGLGYRTVKGDIFLRKTVNNKITRMKLAGTLNNDGKIKRQLNTLIKPNLYRSEIGKFRVRVNVLGKNVCKTYDTQEEAEKYLDSIDKNKSKKYKIKKEKLVKEVTPKLSRVMLGDLMLKEEEPKKKPVYLVLMGTDISDLNIKEIWSSIEGRI